MKWLSHKHQRTLNEILKSPVSRSLTYREVESLLLMLNFKKNQGSGSHVSFKHILCQDLFTVPKHAEGKTLKIAYVLKLKKIVLSVTKEEV